MYEANSNACLPIVYACSGASDVGEISDRAARTLDARGIARMDCLTAISAGIQCSEEIKSAGQEIIALDGCTTGCAYKTLLKHGFVTVKQICVSDLGMAKGDTSITDERVEVVVTHVKASLQTNQIRSDLLNP